MKRLLIILALSLILAACATSGGWNMAVSPLPTPVPLTEIQIRQEAALQACYALTGNGAEGCEMFAGVEAQRGTD